MAVTLNKIRIKGFKSIRDLDLDLKPINILIGSNGVGKSNFISFFGFINAIYEQRLQSYSRQNGADRLLHYGRKQTECIEGYLKFGSNAYSIKLKPTDDDSLYIDSEISSYDNRGDIYPKKNLLESTIKDSPYERDKYLRDYFHCYKIYHFHDTEKGSPLRSKAKLDDNRSLATNGGNLPAFLYALQQNNPKTLKRIELTIRSVMPYFERFELQPSVLDNTQIGLVWGEMDNHNKYFDANDLSDGSLRFIALTALLLQPDLPKVIIIDEPELGLHPVAISKLAGMIKSAAERGCQIIISTQSVNLINYFQPEDIITVDRRDDQSIFERLNNEQLERWLEDYSLGELWAKSVINGQPRTL